MLLRVVHASPTLSSQVDTPQGLSICLHKSGGAQDTSAQMRARLLDIRGDLVSHQCQAIPLDIPG